MKTISYRGTLDIDTQDRIRLKTLKGKVGYKITKFQIMSTTPGASTYELVGKIYNKDQTGSIDPITNFTDSELLAAVFQSFNASTSAPGYLEPVIFDNSITNQDIFVTIADVSGNTVPASYYIELETMDLSEVETTMLTLKNLRTVTSR